MRMRSAGVALVGTEAHIDAIDGSVMAPTAFTGLVAINLVSATIGRTSTYRDRTIMGGLRPSPAVPPVGVPRPKVDATSRRE